MRSLLLLVFILGAIPFILSRPHIGVLFWSWISYMNPHRFTYGAAYTFPFAYIVALATFAGILFSKEQKRMPWNALTVTWLLLVVWMCFTTLFALVPDDAYENWKLAMKIQIMSIVSLLVINTPRRIDALVWVIVLSIGFFGVKGGVFGILTGGEYKIWGPPDSFVTGNNEVGLALVMTIPLMRYLQLKSAMWWVRLALVGAMGLSALSVLITYSRGAFLAIATMAAFMIMKTRKKTLFVLVALVAVPLMWNFMPEEYSERLGTIRTYEQDRSAMGRINAWSFALNVAMERPLVGGGFGVFDPEIFKIYAPDPMFFQDAHSIYFEMLGEQGFLGLGLFLLVGWMALGRCGRIIRDTEGRMELQWARDLAAMCQVSLIGYAIGGAFLGLAYWDLPYHLIAITVITDVLVCRAIAGAGSVAAPVSAPGDDRGLTEETRG
jgi:probable O-glycosylation ligase (exosortase A-associated)